MRCLVVRMGRVVANRNAFVCGLAGVVMAPRTDRTATTDRAPGGKHLLDHLLVSTAQRSGGRGADLLWLQSCYR